MIGIRHDASSCAECNDTGFIDDPLSAVEDGVPDLLPCPRNCGASEEASMLGSYDQWKCTPPVDERELDAERVAVEVADAPMRECPCCEGRGAFIATYDEPDPRTGRHGGRLAECADCRGFGEVPVDDADAGDTVESELGLIERCLVRARQLGELPWALEEGDELSW